MKFGKTDRRFSAHPDFKHFISFTSKELKGFNNIRKWCWETFGASSDLDIFHKISDNNQQWCWEYSQWNTRIYFATDKEYQWFLLKWS